MVSISFYVNSVLAMVCGQGLCATKKAIGHDGIWADTTPIAAAEASSAGISGDRALPALAI